MTSLRKLLYIKRQHQLTTNIKLYFKFDFISKVPLFFLHQNFFFSTSVRWVFLFKEIYGFSFFSIQNLAIKLGFSLNIMTQKIPFLLKLFCISFLDFEGRSPVFLRMCLRRNLKWILQTTSYKMYRFQRGLPVRGQRTHTNSITSRRLKLL